MNQPSIRATVLEAYPDFRYLLKLVDGREVKAYLAGKMRLHRVRCLPGDTVDVVLDPAGGHATNRIVRRV